MPPTKPPRPADDPAWHAEVKSVRKLGEPKRPAPHPARRYTQPPTDVYVPPSAYHRPIGILANTARLQAGRDDHMDLKRYKELSLGRISPTATLDLHGTLEGDAWLRLMNWLNSAVDNNHRCVLVITGKGSGYGPERDMGLIKAQTPQWLAGHPKVLAFHTAQAKDGGMGAVYVLLRRH